MEDFLDTCGRSKDCSSSVGCKSGFFSACNISRVCLLVKDEEIKELPNLDSDVVPRNPIFGDGTLPYRSMDCLKHYQLLQNKYFNLMHLRFIKQNAKMRDEETDIQRVMNKKSDLLSLFITSESKVD